ncbi:MAG TPA: hypothetical protein VNM90_26290 [Haliangium sp.]|nr:hypothetical protein [Haliangium sp.]
MSWNPIETRARAAARRPSLVALACCVAAGLAASGCEDDEPACNRPYDEPRAYLEVRDRNGACTECSAEGGLTIVVGLANGCENTARFTTSSSCLIQDFALVRESGEMVSAGIGCAPAITDWELAPAEVWTTEVEWGRGRDQLSGSWGPIVPGRYRFLMEMTTDLMTDTEVAPAVESEIVITAQ